jgi:hypothetical protein
LQPRKSISSSNSSKIPNAIKTSPKTIPPNLVAAAPGNA